uniref:Uncharacterized protein n=1 Tax=Plectus sambesii TaxID=2011161 RepID=A0A914VTZ4_9BILA
MADVARKAARGVSVNRSKQRRSPGPTPLLDVALSSRRDVRSTMSRQELKQAPMLRGDEGRATSPTATGCFSEKLSSRTDCQRPILH